LSFNLNSTGGFKGETFDGDIGGGCVDDGDRGDWMW